MMSRATCDRVHLDQIFRALVKMYQTSGKCKPEANEFVFDDSSTVASPGALALADCPELPSGVETAITVLATVVKISAKLIEYAGREVGRKVNENYGIEIPNWKQWPDSILETLQTYAAPEQERAVYNAVEIPCEQTIFED